jgi:Copper type II ascorbate-dependent monooxygenase, C-terminal domain
MKVAMSVSQSTSRAAFVLSLACTATLSVACGATPEDGAGSPGGSATAGVMGFTAGTGFAGTGFAGSGAGVGAAGTGSVAGRATTGTTPMPCDVVQIFKLRCQSCHGAMPVGGPMALVSWEDTQQTSVTDAAAPVHAKIAARIHDSVMPMPPTGLLAAEELAVIDAWLAGGAIAGTDPTCAPPMMNPDGGVPQEMPADAENCYEIRAHSGDKVSPLMSNGEHYGNFYFDAPWPAGSQGVYFETLPGDNPEILHHWLVYAEENGNQPDGKVDYPGSGSHPSAPTLVAGWAPGANNNEIPSDVGLQLDGPNRKMSMEIHFFGPEGQTIPTNAGVRICTVESPAKLRPNTATISWLGTELGINIPPNSPSTATGTCTPQNHTEPIHILRSWPHMHLMGRKMESTIIRASGVREAMSPMGGWDFDFNNEISHKTEYVLMPGDKVETKCHYQNTSDRSIQVGFENRYEMCFNFVTAYPAKKLINKGFIGSSSLTNSGTACLN